MAFRGWIPELLMLFDLSFFRNENFYITYKKIKKKKFQWPLYSLIYLFDYLKRLFPPIMSIIDCLFLNEHRVSNCLEWWICWPIWLPSNAVIFAFYNGRFGLESYWQLLPVATLLNQTWSIKRLIISVFIASLLVTQDVEVLNRKYLTH